MRPPSPASSLLVCSSNKPGAHLSSWRGCFLDRTENLSYSTHSLQRHSSRPARCEKAKTRSKPESSISLRKTLITSTGRPLPSSTRIDLPAPALGSAAGLRHLPRKRLQHRRRVLVLGSPDPQVVRRCGPPALVGSAFVPRVEAGSSREGSNAKSKATRRTVFDLGEALVEDGEFLRQPTRIHREGVHLCRNPRRISRTWSVCLLWQGTEKRAARELDTHRP